MVKMVSKDGMSLKHCEDICSSKERVKWGGDKCDNRECNKICSNCKEDYCKWLKPVKESFRLKKLLNMR